MITLAPQNADYLRHIVFDTGAVSKHLHAFEIEVEGASEAYAVDGTPADSVMIALHGPLLKENQFDLVVSGINRGDNCGLHVIYSGTVGAAREAACKDVPAIAFSLASYKARSQEQYAAAAKYAVAIVRAALEQPQSPDSSHPKLLRALKGYVINVNVPGGDFEDIRGLHLATQGQHCSFPDFQEVEVDPHFAAENGHKDETLSMGSVHLRAFRNAAGLLRTDGRRGTDSWAVEEGFVAVCPVGLYSDIPLTEEAATGKRNAALIQGIEEVLQAVGKSLGVAVHGIAAHAAQERM